MDIRQIQYFLRVAEEGSFTRAADKLFLSQSTLSKRIAELEAEIGFSLIRRKGKSLELTESGEVFRREALRLERDYDSLTLEMQALREGKGARLRIAYGMAGHIPYLSDAILTMHSRFPHIEVSTERMFNAEILMALEAGRIDAGIINLPELRASEDMAFATLLPCGLCAFLYRGHPLYHRSSLTLSQLAGERFITFRQDTSPRQLSALLSVCSQHGLDVAGAAFAPDTSAFSMMMSTRQMIGIMPYTTSVFTDTPLHRIPLTDTSGFDMILVWKKGSESTSLQHFQDCFDCK